MSRVSSALVAIAAVSALTACGKKGPPLPPLVKIPAAPADFSAIRRGDDVALQFTVPSTNTDGTRPANIERVDVYGFTGAGDLTDAQLFKRAAKVASVAVKAPRNPDVTVDPDEEDETEPLEGRGLDQGAVARLDDPLTAAALTPTDALDGNGRGKSKAGKPAHSTAPLVGPALKPPVRTYVAVGVSRRGRKGAASKRIGVPLVPPPPPPSAPDLAYDEKSITLTWAPVGAAPTADHATDSKVLPSRPIGMAMREALAYNVYETTGGADKRLNNAPLAEPKYVDTRMTWGAERCFTVRTVQVLSDLAVESDAPSPVCKKLVDTFPPAAPKDLKAVAGQGSINLIWEPNTEKDLAGYIVLRGTSAAALQPLMDKPIQDASYKDDVAAGTHYVYAVKAVDKSGNISAASSPVEETAR